MKRGILLILTLLIITLPTIIAPHTNNQTQNNPVESIILKTINGEIEWETKGYSQKGFKVVWSKNQNPTYPTRNGDKYHYHSNPNKRNDKLEAFDGEGTYFVRVCEYLGGKCGIYSNQIKLELIKKGKETKKQKESHSRNKEGDEEIICKGCLLNKTCYPLGYRINKKFCANDYNLTPQLEENSKCENNFECQSNVCISDECISTGFIRKIINWFKNFF